MHIEREAAGIEGSYGVSSREPEEQRSLTAGFRDRHVVNLAGLVRGPLLQDVVDDVGGARFRQMDVAGVTRESRMDAPSVLARLLFWANDPRVVEFVRDVSACSDIGWFIGRVYRFEPAADHYAAWHDDAFEGRRVALSLNLSEGPLQGGELLIRRKGDGDPPPMAYGPAGDALLFRVSEALEHRVLPVRGTTPRTAFVGWYVAGASFADAVAQARVP